MARIKYVAKKFSADHSLIIQRSNEICAEYVGQGLVLTLRQLYYQHVARGYLPNTQREYSRLSSIMNDARMAGEMDWDYLIDRTRNMMSMRTWESPADLIEKASREFAIDMWANQKQRIVVMIEKDAAIGVVEGVCNSNQVPYFSCRGYPSVSEVWAMAQRIRYWIEDGEAVTLLHVGDHDPSGLDMTRDLDERLRLFVTRDWLKTWGRHAGATGSYTVRDVKSHMREHMRALGSTITDSGSPWTLKRIALNADQIERYSPPPNAAKVSDARFERYVAETGMEQSWELDALDPSVLSALIGREVSAVRDDGLWADATRRHEQGLAELRTTADTMKVNAKRMGK